MIVIIIMTMLTPFSWSFQLEAVSGEKSKKRARERWAVRYLVKQWQQQWVGLGQSFLYKIKTYRKTDVSVTSTAWQQRKFLLIVCLGEWLCDLWCQNVVLIITSGSTALSPPPPLFFIILVGGRAAWWCLCSEWLNDLIFRKELCSQSVCLVIFPTMLVFVFWMISYSAKSSAKHMPGRHTHYGCVCVLNDLFRYW